MTLVRYLAGWLVLASWVVPLAVAAVVVRRRFAPSMAGALARLTEAILVLAALIGTAQLLGAVGELRRLPMTAACLVVAGAGALVAVRGGRRPVEREALPTVGRVGWLVTAGVCALVAVQWAVQASGTLDTGVYNGDSLAYHLLYAVEFYRTGWTTRLVLNAPGAGLSFHPVDSELLHGLAMVAFRRDWLTPLLNLGWLVLALLAAWCLGRRWGRGPATLTAVALVLVPPLMSRSQPGSAMSDIALITCLLAMAVFLVEAWQAPEQRFLLVLAGLTGGLALSMKFNAVPLVAAATVAVPVLAGRGRRLASTATWVVPLVVTGSFWYVRNLVRVGSPIPTMHLGPLPVSHQSLVEKYGYSVASYATDKHVIAHWFLPGFRFSFGPLWFVMLALATVGVLLAFRRGVPPALRGVAVVAAVGAVGYVVTPTTAFGARGEPILFALNLRYVIPALALALPLLPLVLPATRRVQGGVLAVLAGATVVTAFTWGRWHAFPSDHLARAAGLAALAVVAAVAVALVVRRGSLGLTAGLAGAALVVGLAAGLPVSRHYLSHRYAVTAAGYADTYRWASGQHDARIGIDGFVEGYGLTGKDLSNVVRYVGAVGPSDSLSDFTDCGSYLRAVNAGGYRYLVFAPPLDLGAARPPAAAGWVARSPDARLVLRSGLATVYQVSGPLEPAACHRAVVTARPGSGTGGTGR